MNKSGLNLITDPFHITSVTYPKIIVGCDDPQRRLYLHPQSGEDIKSATRFQDHKTGLHCFLFELESIPNGEYIATSQYRVDDKVLERDVVVLVKDRQVVTAVQIKRG